MKTAREAALLVLYEIEYNGAYSNIALKDILAASDLDERDRALASALVYGVVSTKLTLDYAIQSLSKIKLKKLSKYILQILRMGLYQIKYMDKIPDSAAVNESVRLARRYGHSASAGYVNGVLRAASRSKMPQPPNDWIKYSFGERVADRLFADYGKSATDIMIALNKEPKMTVRANTLKINRDALSAQLKAEPCPIVPHGLYVKRLDAAASAEFNEGLFTVQDAAPQMACLALAPKPNEVVVDVCAAPGGKTTYIAELMKNSGRVVAFDIHPHRVELIKKNALRLGIDIIEATEWDAGKVKEELRGTADRVIADVPCSGLGIARRKPELKYKTDFDGLSDIQYNILNAASEYLKVGGRLIYSTCTLYRDENEYVVERFLKEHSNFELVPINPPEGFVEDREGMMTVLPDETDCDGFFVAALIKKD